MPSYRSSSRSNVSDAIATSCTVPVPTGAAAGDIAFFAIEQWWDSGSIPVVTWPTGFTLCVSFANGTGQKLQVAWKRLTGADTGSYVASWAGSQWNQGQAILITGAAASGDPIGNTNTATGSGSTIPTTSLTLATAAGLAHFVANESSATKSPPTGFTEAIEGNYLATNYRFPGAGGTYSAVGATMSVSTASLAALVSILPDEGGGATHPVSGTAAATTTTTGTVAALRPVSGTAAVTSGTIGAVALAGNASGVVVVQSGTTGSITVRRAASGQVDAVTATSGSAAALRSVSGTTAATTSTSGSVTVRHAVSGVVAAVTTTSGTVDIAGSLALSGTVTIESSTSGAVTARLAVAGTVAVDSSATGAVTSRQSVAASVTVLSDTTGAVTLSALVAGTVAVHSGTSGTVVLANELRDITFTGRVTTRTIAGHIGQRTITGQVRG